MPIVDETKNHSVMIDDIFKVEQKKVIGVDYDTEKGKGKGKINEPVVKKIP